jgi:hypothetical protein
MDNKVYCGRLRLSIPFIGIFPLNRSGDASISLKKHDTFNSLYWDFPFESTVFEA